MNTRSFLLSALISGAVIGILANLPVLNLINCFLCIWVWVGGILAVYLYQRFQREGPSLTGGQGAGLGAVAGLIGAFIGVIVYALTSFISTPLFQGLANLFDIGDLPFTSGGWTGVFISAFFFFTIDAILYPLFGALSGLLGASLFKKEPQA